MNEEHLKALFDAFVSMVKPFVRNTEQITLYYWNNGESNELHFEGDFEGAGQKISFSKEWIAKEEKA